MYKWSLDTLRHPAWPNKKVTELPQLQSRGLPRGRFAWIFTYANTRWQVVKLLWRKLNKKQCNDPLNKIWWLGFMYFVPKYLNYFVSVDLLMHTGLQWICVCFGVCVLLKKDQSKPKHDCLAPFSPHLSLLLHLFILIPSLSLLISFQSCSLCLNVHIDIH